MYSKKYIFRRDPANFVHFVELHKCVILVSLFSAKNRKHLQAVNSFLRAACVYPAGGFSAAENMAKFLIAREKPLCKEGSPGFKDI